MTELQEIETKYKQADKALYDHDPATAARLLQELVESEPREPLFHWSLGYAFSEMGDYQRAIPEFQQALKFDSRNVPALGGIGRAYMELGKWELAERAIRERLALKKSPQHYVFLAHILMEKDQYDAAAESCLKAIDLAPTFAEPFLNLGLAYRHEKRFDDALRAFQKASELDAKYSAAFQELGLTYYYLKKFDLAEESLRKCLTLNSHDSWGHLYLAFTLQQTGQLDSAATHFDEALKSDPENQFIKEKRDEFHRGRE